MTQYFFEISYDGTSYFGWQIQPKQISVQETIEKALTKLNRQQKVSIVGCGRTDTGVHAKSYFFHAQFENEIDPTDWKYKLNKMLPESISVQQVFQSELHARFDAKKRTYRYFIHQTKNPFNAAYSWYIPQNLDFEKMNEAAQLMIGNHDFTSFSKLHTDVTNNFCTVFSAHWVVNEHEIYFEISANRFLRNMVRATVGTLLEVGLSKININEFGQIIAAKDRGEAALSVPAHGLFLWDIDYSTTNI